ncbi:MAG: aldo/keto reductase [Calditrichaceae bacterium]|nr:aldo/keto reductase [Calditrichaceae bacterium]MBN2708364.1 aldo/keto reductase [Calditrichaceae bacterium]RQV93107.1 MAG: aldo/keto reductase [Calditrichota bacterium]
MDPSLIPNRVLKTGDKIPCIGLGTFGSDSVSADIVAQTVKKAINAGYRHIDCASVYGNEKNIGIVLNEVFNSGFVKREDLWITSKVWNDMHNHVAESCAQSLADLKIDYLDLYLVHWPFSNYHPPNCDVTSRSPNAKPYIHENYMNTWRQMEKLVEENLVKNIGTSNMTIPKLNLLLRDSRIKPLCNEMELHPHFQQTELFEYCQKHQIQPIAYCPLGSPGRPERDRTPEDTVDLEDPVILSIAERLKITPAQVALQWAVKRGQIPIPFSVNHFLENLEAAVNIQLTEKDMQAIGKIDRNCRLIKGQVFLWKEYQSWEDLWDIDGVIVS